MKVSRKKIIGKRKEKSRYKGGKSYSISTELSTELSTEKADLSTDKGKIL